MLAITAHHHVTPLHQVHIGVALGITAAYMSVPFIPALRRLPLTRGTRIAAGLFFATCALTHLAIAAGFHDSPWMLLSDLVQLISVVAFVVLLSRALSHTGRRREHRDTGSSTTTPAAPGRLP